MKIKLCTIDIGAKLLPGIKEAIGRYQADGWHIVIISTQGRAVISTDVRIGDYVPHGADLYRVEKIDRDKWGVIFKYDKYKGGSQFEWFDLNDEVLIQCKTV